MAKRVEVVDLDEVGIARTVESSRALRCFDTHAGGYELPDRMTLRLKLDPDGRLLKAELDPNFLSGTRLERCMNERLRAARFPQFEGDAPVPYHYTIVR